MNLFNWILTGLFFGILLGHTLSGLFWGIILGLIFGSDD